MYQPGKMHNIIQEMNRLKINILGLSEARWPNSGYFSTNNGTIYYSGTNKTKHSCGIAIILDKSLTVQLKDFLKFQKRVMLLQLNTSHSKLNLIQTYALTIDGNEEEVGTFCQQL